MSLKITFEFTEENVPASMVMAALEEAVGAIDIHSVDIRAEKHVGEIKSVEGPERVIGRLTIENRQLPQNQNIVTDVHIGLQKTGDYLVSVTKAFAEEHGGGTQNFDVCAMKNIHAAMDGARQAVTVSPGSRTDLVRSEG